MIDLKTELLIAWRRMSLPGKLAMAAGAGALGVSMTLTANHQLEHYSQGF